MLLFRVILVAEEVLIVWETLTDVSLVVMVISFVCVCNINRTILLVDVDGISFINVPIEEAIEIIMQGAYKHIDLQKSPIVSYDPDVPLKIATQVTSFNIEEGVNVQMNRPT